MKNRSIVLLLWIVIPALLYPVSEKKVTISKLIFKPQPFNEKRDPVTDSPLNAFDGNTKTSALYSDFTIIFSEPVSMNEIKIINGSAGDKSLFKINNRLRDIEITLYTIDTPSEKNAQKTQIRKKKKSKPVKKTAPVIKKPEKIKPENKIPEPDNKKNIKTNELINIACDTDEYEHPLIFIALNDDKKQENTSTSKTIDKGNKIKEQPVNKENKSQKNSSSDKKNKTIKIVIIKQVINLLFRF